VGVFADLKGVAQILVSCVGEQLLYGILAHFYSCVTFAQEIYRIGVHLVCPFVFFVSIRSFEAEYV
jgi:hypothetical protein